MGLFDEIAQGRSIYKDRDLLTGKKLPDNLLHREEQIKELAYNLAHVQRGDTPPHMHLVGPPGSGKTATIIHVLSELKKFIEKKKFGCCSELHPCPSD